MSKPCVLLEREGGLARIVLNRPAAGNAINLPMARELFAVAAACDDDPAVRCVMLTGAERMFCAGGDVALFASSGDALPEVVRELAHTLHLAQSRLSRIAKPLIVLVNGPAAGAGFGLSLFGDLVVASRSASFTPAYGRLGLSPDGGLSWLLPRLIGLRRAQEVLLTNRRITADEAAAWGLVTRTVEGDELQSVGDELAQHLLAMSGPATCATRKLLLEGFASTLEAQLEQETRAIAGLSGGAEAQERIAAFMRKAE